METKEVPSEWKESILIPIFKKGDQLDPNNYRGISLINTIPKIFMLLVTQRLYAFVQNY